MKTRAIGTHHLDGQQVGQLARQRVQRLGHICMPSEDDILLDGLLCARGLISAAGRCLFRNQLVVESDMPVEL